MKHLGIISGIIALVYCAISPCRAQDADKNLLNQVEQDDQKAVDAIAMYPSDVRKDIFMASQYPEILVRLSAIQKMTKEQFSAEIASFPKEQQEKIWNLTRFPDLIHDLVSNNAKASKEIDAILANYPEEIHKDAKEEAEKNFDLLVNLDQQNNKAGETLEAALKPYAVDVGNAYRDLIRYPEVLNTLYDNMQLTVVIGNVYKQAPRYVMHQSDSLNAVLTAQDKKDAQDWTQSMSDNPDVQQEYVQSAQEYAKDNGYTEDEYTAPLEPDVDMAPSYSYNWWWGYPDWYPYAYWDPHPFWYDWGFCYGPHHHPRFFGMPSAYFMSWYFYNPEHHVRYPELSNHYYNYYYGHRDEASHYNSVSREVDAWRQRNGDVVNKDWDSDSKGRIERFKEYGQMEVARNKYNKENPAHTMDHAAFLTRNKGAYSNLKAEPVKGTAVRGAESSNMHEQMAPQKEPHVAIPDSYRAKETPSTTGLRNVFRSGSSGRTNTHSSTLHSAQEYHQSSWDQIRPAPIRYSSPPVHYAAPMRSGGFPAAPAGRRR